MILAIFFKDSIVFVTFRATFRDSFLFHGHLNYRYTKHKINIYQAILKHILLINFKSWSFFCSVCLSLNTIRKFNSLIKGWDRVFLSGVFFSNYHSYEDVTNSI